MANEDQKNFNAMLHGDTDMPKIQIITDTKTIEKYGGTRMYFAPPLDYDRVMRQVPFGKLITVGDIRAHFAKANLADFTDPITAGIFVCIPAGARRRKAPSRPGPARSATVMKPLTGARSKHTVN